MRIHNLLITGGHFILEPQGSDSYERAVKKNPELKVKREALKVKPEEFVSLLEKEYGFELVKSLGEGDRKRVVYVFKKL
jgi:7SK snRNA methylphosphate capping enzyme